MCIHMESLGSNYRECQYTVFKTNGTGIWDCRLMVKDLNTSRVAVA